MSAGGLLLPGQKSSVTDVVGDWDGGRVNFRSLDLSGRYLSNSGLLQ